MKSLPYFLIILGILSPVFSYLLTFLNIRWSLFLGIIDEPNQRSSHEKPTPRGGGMAIVFTFVLFMFIVRRQLGIASSPFWGLIINAVLIAGLGFLDDLYTLRQLPRIIGWVVIALNSISYGIEINSISIPFIGLIEFGVLSPLVTFIWLIGVTNFYNFMDGIDGIAGCEALIVSGFMAGIAYLSGNTFIFVASVIIFGAVLGFLPHNFPKAKLFMGDGGSNFLGFLFAALGVIGSQFDSGYIPFLVPVILLNMFLLDAGSTLIKRIPKGKEWLEPHRDHVYQRLIKLGYSHAQVTLLYTILSILMGIMAVIFYQSNDQMALGLIVASFIPYYFLMFITHQLEKKRIR